MATQVGVTLPVSGGTRSPSADEYSDTWVVLPTYNEALNLRSIASAITTALPGSQLLVVDDGSPDGTGAIADEIAVENKAVHVLHRAQKDGLGPAYVAGFGVALTAGAGRIVQMDADWSHDPAALPGLVSRLDDGPHIDLVIGSRWVPGGGTVGWPLSRRLLSRSGSLYARLVLSISIRDITGGFKVWRARALADVIARPVQAGGYAFQIETTYRLIRSGGRVIESPITFAERRAGMSKMSTKIVVEALRVVLNLRTGRTTGDRMPLSAAAIAGAPHDE